MKGYEQEGKSNKRRREKRTEPTRKGLHGEKKSEEGRGEGRCQRREANKLEEKRGENQIEEEGKS